MTNTLNSDVWYTIRNGVGIHRYGMYIKDDILIGRELANEIKGVAWIWPEILRGLIEKINDNHSI